MHHAVAKIGREDFARLGAVGDEADRTSRPVSVGAEFLLQYEEIFLCVDLEGQGIGGVALGVPFDTAARCAAYSG